MSDETPNVMPDEPSPNDAPKPAPAMQPTEAARRIELVLKADADLRRIDAEIARVESEQEELKGDLKALRERRERAINRMRSAAQGTAVEQLALPFSSAPPDDGAWRGAGVEQLQVPEKILAALHEAGLDTIGALADFTADERKHLGRGLMAIKGIGEAAEAKLQDAIEFFWARWGRQSAQGKQE